MVSAAHGTSSYIPCHAVLHFSLAVFKQLFLAASILPVKDILRNVNALVNRQLQETCLKGWPIHCLKYVVGPLLFLLNVCSQVVAVSEVADFCAHLCRQNGRVVD